MQTPGEKGGDGNIRICDKQKGTRRLRRKRPPFPFSVLTPVPLFVPLKSWAEEPTGTPDGPFYFIDSQKI